MTPNHDKQIPFNYGPNPTCKKSRTSSCLLPKGLFKLRTLGLQVVTGHPWAKGCLKVWSHIQSHLNRTLKEGYKSNRVHVLREGECLGRRNLLHTFCIHVSFYRTRHFVGSNCYPVHSCGLHCPRHIHASHLISPILPCSCSRHGATAKND